MNKTIKSWAQPLAGVVIVFVIWYLVCKTEILSAYVLPPPEKVFRSFLKMLPKSIDLKAAINELKKEKNAVILGHYYQKGEIQDIADYIGDSLALAQIAAKTDADILVTHVLNYCC